MTKFLSLTCLLLAGAVLIAKDPPASAKVKVTLVVILAREDGNTIDKKLKAIAQEVQITYPHLKSFTLKSMATRSLAPDEKAAIPVVDGKTVTIVVKHGTDKEKRVSLAVLAPDQGEIVYRSVCEKFLPIVTRYQTKSKELLILAIRAQPCKDE